MSPVGFLKREMMSIFAPTHAWCDPFVLEKVSLRFDLLATRNIKNVQLIGRELVSRQGVGTRLELSPATSRRRGLNQVHFFTLARRDAPGDEGRRVRGPI